MSQWVDALEPRTFLSASMVSDVNTTGVQAVGYPLAQPRPLVEVDGTLYFTYDDGTSGPELWRSDGTAAGTRIVKDIVPGPGGYAPTALANVNGVLYFGGSGGVLWRSDGTGAGTVQIAQVLPISSDAPQQIIGCNGIVFFAMGGGLWRSDGTAAGTVAVGNASYRPMLTDAGGTLFFVGYGPDSKTAICKSDGTVAGTGCVKDIRPGQNDLPDSVQITAVGKQVFFTANDGVSGVELWQTDGTPGGTRLAGDFDVGPSSSKPADLVAFDHALYFTADATGLGRKIFRTDGTSAATVVGAANGGAGGYANPVSLTVAGDAIYFSASSAGATQLWVTDGTTDGTRSVAPIPAVAGGAVDFTPVGGSVYFTTVQTGIGMNLWVSNGSPAGTSVVTNIVPGTPVVNGARLHGLGGKLFFASGGGSTVVNFRTTDGTAAGTVLVKQFNGGSAPSEITTVNGKIFFTADDGVHGRKLWKSDGTAAGTVLLKDVFPGTGVSGSPHSLTAVGGTLLFVASGVLWKSDGTSAGTTPVRAPGSEASPAHPTHMTVVGGTCYFMAGSTTAQLWKSDGTEAGTVMLKEIVLFGAPIPTEPVIGFFGVLGDTLLFSAYDRAHGIELWRTNGTAAGTTLVRDINPGAGDGVPNPSFGPAFPDPRMVRIGDALYFWANDGVSGIELWRTDGTSGGTRTVKDVTPGPAGSLLLGFTGDGPILYALVSNSAGLEVWRSDGTPGGTVSIKRLVPQTDFLNFPSVFTAVGNRLYFYFKDAATGGEVWTSDGTPANTGLLKDLLPGGGDGVVWYLSGFAAGPDGLVYFTADDGINGTSVWRSDGTAAGTERLPDAYPGAGDANPSSFAFNGDDLFFAASDGEHGLELWKQPFRDTTPPAVVDARFVYQTAPPSVTFAFSEDVSATLAAAGLTIRRSDGGADFHPASVSWNPLTNTATFTFAGPLPDADYRATLLAAAIRDAAGNPLPADRVLDFFVLAGDANRDRTVGFADLALVAQNYDTTGRSFADGDVNGDGRVDFADLVMVAQRYDATVPAPAPAPTLAAAPRKSIVPRAAEAPKPSPTAPAKPSRYSTRRIVRR